MLMETQRRLDAVRQRVKEGFPPQATALASLRASPEGGRGESL
jgi:hypothetical protein